MKKSFDNKKYIKLQTDKILERVQQFEGKLYLEFGGKIFDDYHASRVLKGFEIDSKVRVMSMLKDKIEILLTVNANDIQTTKVRSDVNVSYEDDVLRIMNKFETMGFFVNGVVITQYNQQPMVDIFIRKLKNFGIKYYIHYPIMGYPHNVDYIISEEGFGKNDYIETKKPIIIVTAPGPGSGKMATCLSQLYHDHIRGIKSGYAKYETFPIWNLSLKHPVNLAYEAATADLCDINMIDFYHLEAYGITAVNYNRDLEVFPVLRKMFERIYDKCPYASPTDMGVNMAGFAIIDDLAAQESSKQEIIRRYLDAKYNYKIGRFKQEGLDKITLVMKELNITVDNRKVVKVANEKAEKKGIPYVAIEMANGKIITGKKSNLFTASSAAIINAIKFLAKIPDDLPLLSYSLIDPIQKLKSEQLHRASVRLHLDEVLITLAITATTNPMAQKALEQLNKLNGLELHSSLIIDNDDIVTLKRLGINSTMEAILNTKYQ